MYIPLAIALKWSVVYKVGATIINVNMIAMPSTSFPAQPYKTFLPNNLQFNESQ
jgi:hypothetical protein